MADKSRLLEALESNPIQTNNSVLSTETIGLLNDAIKKETCASRLYVAVSAWCNKESYFHTADFFAKHMQGEITHMQELYDYMIVKMATPITPNIDAPRNDYKNLCDLICYVYDDMRITTKFYEDIIMKVKDTDITTFTFLQDYIQEQIKGERWASDLVGKIKACGDTPLGYTTFDNWVEDYKY